MASNHLNESMIIVESGTGMRTQIIDVSDIEDPMQQQQEPETVLSNPSSPASDPSTGSPVIRSPRSKRSTQRTPVKFQEDPDGISMTSPSPLASKSNNDKEPAGFLMKEGDMLDRVFTRIESKVCSGEEESATSPIRGVAASSPIRGVEPPPSIKREPFALFSCNSIVVEDEEFAAIMKDMEEGDGLLQDIELGSPESAEAKHQEHEERNSLPPSMAVAADARSVIPLQMMEYAEEKKSDSMTMEENDHFFTLDSKNTTRTDNTSKKQPQEPKNDHFFTLDSKNTKRTDNTSKKQPQEPYTPKGDLLDYIFENVERFTCKEKKEGFKSPRAVGVRTAPMMNDFNSLMDIPTDDEDSEGSSPMKLHKLATPYNNGGQPDALDFIFDNVERGICRQHTKSSLPPVEDSLAEKPSTATGGGPSSMRSSSNQNGSGVSSSHLSGNRTREEMPRFSRSQISSQKSLLDAACLSEDDISPRLGAIPQKKRQKDGQISSQSFLDVAHSLADDISLRLDSIRQKKRQIEAQVKSSSDEPGILVPRGYKEKFTIENGMSEETERRNKFQRTVAAGLVFFLIAVAMVLVGVSFFWPTSKMP
jgi:hypothetical protein